MGVILPKPITSKVVERAGSTNVSSACCSVNGFRNSMEDAHCQVIGQDRMIFGVFDGHSNDKCSQYIGEHLPGKINAQPLPIPDATMEKICLDLDAQFLEDVGDGGTTATFCVIEPSDGKFKVQVCNVGDSRTIIVRDNQIMFATEDHKPVNPGERARIERAGGTVRMNRVDGDLAVSRAFGDRFFKKSNRDDPRGQKVVCVPDITHHECQPGDTIVICCDGVFEGTFPNEEVVAFVGQEMKEAKSSDLAVIASRVCDKAIRRGSKDNISCMIVHFADGTEMVKSHGDHSFVPGPPFPKSHDGAKQAYNRMATIAGTTLADALQQRYELLQAYVNGALGGLPPIQQTAFEMSDDVDIETEKAFFGPGPARGEEKTYFANLAR